MLWRTICAPDEIGDASLRLYYYWCWLLWNGDGDCVVAPWVFELKCTFFLGKENKQTTKLGHEASLVGKKENHHNRCKLVISRAYVPEVYRDFTEITNSTSSLRYRKRFRLLGFFSKVEPGGEYESILFLVIVLRRIGPKDIHS